MYAIFPPMLHYHAYDAYLHHTPTALRHPTSASVKRTPRTALTYVFLSSNIYGVSSSRLPHMS
jgi:hypothetical protein